MKDFSAVRLSDNQVTNQQSDVEEVKDFTYFRSTESKTGGDDDDNFLCSRIKKSNVAFIQRHPL